MTDSTVFEKTYSARSVRVFDRSRPVGRENLEYFIDCARVCPTAANLQPLKYFIADDRETADSLFKLTKWAGYFDIIVVVLYSKSMFWILFGFKFWIIGGIFKKSIK